MPKEHTKIKGACEERRKQNENCMAFTHCVVVVAFFWAFVNLISMLLLFLFLYT